MNEEANFCSQCGATVTLGAKFCSNCGYDLQNSSTQTPLDKTIKVEVTNATVEKGFKAVGEGFEAVGKVFKRKEKRGFLRKTFKNLVKYTERKRQEKKAEQPKKEKQKTSVDIEDGIEINGNLLFFLALIFVIGCTFCSLKL